MSLPFDVSGARSTDVGSCTVWRAKSFRVLLPLVTAADGANVRCEFSRKKKILLNTRRLSLSTHAALRLTSCCSGREREKEREYRRYSSAKRMLAHYPMHTIH